MKKDVQNQIETLLQQEFHPEYLEVMDDSAKHRGHAGAMSGGGHYQVTLISAKFSGKTLIEQHQMVYQALQGLMGEKIHALALKTQGHS